jgi:hypothetical protein
MSHILLKKVQDNLISTPASNYIKFFSNDNDNGLLYYMDSSGDAHPIAGENYNPVVNTTYSGLYSLYQSNGFATGSYYCITDFDSVYEQPDFYFDGTIKTSLSLKGKPAIPYQPIIVMAIASNILAPDAYQPYYPKDKIKYDFTWNKTEFNRNAKGRITERVDSNGNISDYDHRTIRFKRYQNYDRTNSLGGYITTYNCVSGALVGNSTTFDTDLVVGDIIFIDTDIAYGGDLNYTIGLKVKSIINSTNIEVEVDNLYASGVPSTITLNNSSSQIIPTNYSFSGKSYTYNIADATGSFNSYKELYFGQHDADDFDAEVFTFTSTGWGANIVNTVSDNFIGNYSNIYLSGENNSLILPNIVFSDSYAHSNKIGDKSCNNHFTDTTYHNVISSKFSNNTINNSFYNNKIDGKFYNNIIGEMTNNMIFSDFENNKTKYGYIFRNNYIRCKISNINFLSSTHVYGNYNCDIFSNSLGFTRLSYYDVYDVMNIVDVNS